MFKLFSKYTEYIRRLRSIVKVKKPITEYVVKYYVLGEDQPFCISLFELSERNESYDVTALKRSRDVVKSTISFEFDENLNCTKKKIRIMSLKVHIL